MKRVPSYISLMDEFYAVFLGFWTVEIMFDVSLLGRLRAGIAQKINKHGTTFKYKRFPPALMRMIGFFNDEVSYPLKYIGWYQDQANDYDFARNADLADLEKIHPRWTFEQKLREWGIDELKPRKKMRG